MHKTFTYQARVSDGGHERRMSGTVETSGAESPREAIEAEIAATVPDAELLSITLQEVRP